MDEDRHRHPARRLRARRSRRIPKRKGLLFLGTETGIYVSFDDGGVVAALQSRPAGHAGARHHRQERRSRRSRTHGRVVLRDGQHQRAAPDRARKRPTSAVVLFKPGDAMRSVSRGVAVDYFLKQAADTVTIDVSDEPKGKVIKTFTGTAAAAGAPPPPATVDDGVRPAPPPVAGEAGAEPFRVGHALSGREGLPGTDHVGRQRARPGGAAREVPGAADRRRRQPKTQAFAIVRNPQHQRDRRGPARAVRAGAARSTTRYRPPTTPSLRIRDMKEQVGDRSGKANDARIKSAGDAL